MDHRAQAERAAAEIGSAVAAVDPGSLAAFVAQIAGAKRIALYGVGREGLMMRAFAMRLYHLGLDAHVVGDMSCPPVGVGDLLVVSAGPGDLSTVGALIGVAAAAGARVACVTAQPGGSAPRASDVVLVIPAQTMADDVGAGDVEAGDVGAGGQGAGGSVLPMGSVFEGAQFLTFELVVLALRDRGGIRPHEMRARHTNLE